MTKKIISCIVALTLILSFAVLSVSADVPKLTIAASTENVKLGENVTVDFAVTAPAQTVAYFAFTVNWNQDLLTYQSSTLGGGITSDTSVDENNVASGVLTYQTVRDANADMTFESTVVLSVTFTAASTIDEDPTTTPITLVKWSDADEAYYDNGFDAIAAADVAVSDGSVTLSSGPSVSIGDIAQEAPVAVAITPVVTPSSDELTVTKVWTIGEGDDAEVIEDEDSYTPAAADMGKTITFAVTVTDGTDEATATKTFTVVKNTELKPAVEFVSYPSSVAAGKTATIIYKYEDGNGLENKSDVTVKVLSDEIELTMLEDKDYELTVKGETITVKPAKELIGKKFTVTVAAYNEDGDEGNAITTEPIEVKKAKSSSGSERTGASLVAKKDDDKDTTKDNDKDEDNDKEVSESLKKASKDAIVLEIGNKDASVFGDIETNDVAPIIRNDRTMLPARFVAEALGAEVAWDDETKTVTITKDDITIVIVIDADKATVNGEEVELDSPAFIENSRTYTPIRFIAEALGADVAWDDAAKLVTITPAE